MKDPVDHIARARPPWRQGPEITECGLNASKVSALSRDQYAARLKDLGSMRTAMTVCMTCGDAARRWGNWETDPRQVVGREVEWEMRSRRTGEKSDQFLHELNAIARLIEAHPDEFATLVEHQKGRADWLRKKAAMKPRRAGDSA